MLSLPRPPHWKRPPSSSKLYFYNKCSSKCAKRAMYSPPITLCAAASLTPCAIFTTACSPILSLANVKPVLPIYWCSSSRARPINWTLLMKPAKPRAPLLYPSAPVQAWIPCAVLGSAVWIAWPMSGIKVQPALRRWWTV